MPDRLPTCSCGSKCLASKFESYVFQHRMRAWMATINKRMVMIHNRNLHVTVSHVYGPLHGSAVDLPGDDSKWQDANGTRRAVRHIARGDAPPKCKWIVTFQLSVCIIHTRCLSQCYRLVNSNFVRLTFSQKFQMRKKNRPRIVWSFHFHRSLELFIQQTITKHFMRAASTIGSE